MYTSEIKKYFKKDVSEKCIDYSENTLFFDQLM